MGQAPRAEPLFRELVEDVRRVYGDKHAEMGVALNNLGNALSDIPEKYAEAAEVYLAAAEITRRTRGDLHPETATAYNNLGALYLKTQDWEKADEAFQRAIAIRLSVFGPDHPHTAPKRCAVGRRHWAGWAALTEAVPWQKSVASYAATLGPEHWRTAFAQLYLGWVFALEGRRDEATREMNQAYPKLLTALGADHPRVGAAKGLMLEVGIENAT